MAERNSKKQKTEDDAVKVFKDFLFDETNEELISMLRGVLVQIGTGFGHSSVFFLRVKAANANSCVSFSKASVDVEVQRQNSYPLVAPLVLFFVRGYALLSDFLDDDNPGVPENIGERQALEDLLQFLKKPNEQSVLTEIKDKSETVSELELAIRITQHLLVPLVPHKTFVIDSSKSAVDAVTCCPNLQPMEVVKGDTSFGCSKGWHGCADILLKGNEVPITVVETAENPVEFDATSVSSDSSVEIKKGQNFTSDTIAQVTAQTIVSSFVQHKKNPKSPTSLVPGIGICAKKLIVYLYDCVEDILLTSGPVDLYAKIGERNLDTRAIIILWLALNYDVFGNKTPDTLNGNKAAFHDVIGPVQYEAYKNESVHPCQTTSDDDDDLFKCWAEENVSFRFNIKKYLPERKLISLK